MKLFINEQWDIILVHEMHSIWFMCKVTEDINFKFFVNLEF